MRGAETAASEPAPHTQHPDLTRAPGLGCALIAAVPGGSHN